MRDLRNALANEKSKTSRLMRVIEQRRWVAQKELVLTCHVIIPVCSDISMQAYVHKAVVCSTNEMSLCYPWQPVV